MVDKKIKPLVDSLHNILLNKGLDNLSELEYKLLNVVREISKEIEDENNL